MQVGTKSVLFGVHQFLLHPLMVYRCWRQLYGRIRWWEAVALFCHDLGYWGCDSMDGVGGERHPEFGGELTFKIVLFISDNIVSAIMAQDLAVGHSKTFSRLRCQPVSRLWAADKLGSTIYPRWLYLFLARLSGELAEYRQNAARYHERSGKGCPLSATDEEWFEWMGNHLRSEVEKARKRHEER